MAGSYASITTTPNVSRMGGTQQRVFLMPIDDFETLQGPDKTSSDIADHFKIKEAHVPKSGKGFIELYVTKDTGEVNFSPIGASDRRSFKAEGEFFHPGESDAIEVFANQCTSDRWIMLVPLPGGEEVIQIGSEEFQVELTPAYSTTKNSGDGRGWTFKFECYMPSKPKYQADIPMMP